MSGVECRVLFLAATTYDVHRSIKNNEKPPSREQLQALEDYINSAAARRRDDAAAHHGRSHVVGYKRTE
ncbi:UNVERIFIED_CONTAM: hypothetical protein Slati_2898900 [Sesamum latifolium]|uniref:Uncharacterized protein n=1 Tax=Sesamum latifolium TaxID=2727402 RepID=A0AAW2VHS1_9LAMI